MVTATRKMQHLFALRSARALKIAFVVACCASPVALARAAMPVSSETCANGDETCRGSSSHNASVPELDPDRLAFLASHGIQLFPMEPLGARVIGVDLRNPPSDDAVLFALQDEMAARGFLLFPGQGVLTAAEQIRASMLWGGRQMHSTHGVHPKAPDRHIFRLSNDQNHGTLGVGPQWHNDGSFVVDVFSHVGYHIVEASRDGDTLFAHQGAAFDALSPEEQERWSRLTSVNSNSGVLHPVVHDHPISGRRSVWLHLGMTGAVLEFTKGEGQAPEGYPSDFRLLDEQEMTALFNRYNELLNSGLSEGYALSHRYAPGDCVFIDNLAIAHRASAAAHEPAHQHGLRILHRTTVKAPGPFQPSFGLPQRVDMARGKPFRDGVWINHGLGFRWDPNIRMQN